MSVNEDVGLFQLCVKIFTKMSFLRGHRTIDFSLDLSTNADTAGKVHYTHAYCHNITFHISSLKVLVITLRSPPPTIFLCHLPLILQLMNSVSMSLSLMTELWKTMKLSVSTYLRWEVHLSLSSSILMCQQQR